MWALGDRAGIFFAKGGTGLRIKKVINNNILCAIDEKGTEMIVTGRGIGFGRKVLSVFEENRRHEMVKNPLFRFVPYPCEGEAGDKEKGYLAACGKPLPLVERVVFEIEKEAVPLQTKFLQGYYDSPSIDRVDTGLGYLTAMADSPEKLALYTKKNLRFPETVEASFWYLGFNWLDPVLGGDKTPEEARRARLLRQAISIAVDWEENIAIFQKNQGIPAHGPLPPRPPSRAPPGNAAASGPEPSP